MNKISGPVSLNYLVPKEEIFSEKAGQGVFLPIVILLGDIHYSEENRCEPCEEKDGCFLVESDTFLRSLDQVASEYPVDVYTEYSPNKESKGKGVLFNKFIGKTESCYQTFLRGTRNYRCNFPRVRWHYADTRFWKNKTESEVSEVANYLSYLRTADLRISYQLQNTPPLFKNFLLRILESHKKDETMDSLAKRWANLLDSTISGNKKSVVYKQLIKYKLGINIDYYCYSSLEYHKVVSNRKVRDEIDSTIYSLYNYFFYGERLREYDKTLLDTILILWVKYTSCLLDIYFLGRMFKPPKDNINSYITVGFFGNEHSKALTDFLLYRKEWYDLMYSSEDSDRCVRINGKIDVDRDLIMYSKWRVIHQNIRPYIEKLTRERFLQSI